MGALAQGHEVDEEHNPSRSGRQSPLPAAASGYRIPGVASFR